MILCLPCLKVTLLRWQKSQELAAPAAEHHVQTEEHCQLEVQEEEKPTPPVKLRIKMGRGRKQSKDIPDSEAPTPSTSAVSLLHLSFRQSSLPAVCKLSNSKSFFHRGIL